MNGSSHEHSSNLIRATGMRVTKQRVAVLDVVGANPHASAAMVLAAIEDILPGMSHQAVYDCLAQLTEAGLLRRLTVDGGPALYETRVDDNHHHFVCRGCGLVADIDCAVGSAPCLSPVKKTRFMVDEAEITFRGLCPACAAVQPNSSIR